MSLVQFLFSSGPEINISFSTGSKDKIKKKVNIPGSEAQEELCVYEGQEVETATKV